MPAPAEHRKFPKSARVRSKLDFAHVYEHGVRIGDQCLLLIAVRTELPQTRLGLSVSKRSGNAIQRNRWKRLLREVFRLTQPELPPGFDLVVQPRSNVQPTFDAIRQSFTSIIARLKKRRSKSGDTP